MHGQTSQQGSGAGSRQQEASDAEAVKPAAAPAANRIDESQLVGLPMNGRSYSQLATLQGGVSDPSAASGSRGVGGGGLTVAGGRPTSNVFLMDGTNIMDSENRVPRSAAGVQLDSDAVLQVQVFSTGYSAEYGRGSGGILNSITRSGTPEIHANFFEFFRNSKLDSKNFFDPSGEPIPPFKRNQFGFTVTAPVVKGKTFVMGSYEALRDRLSQTTVDFFPDREARQGVITNSAGQVVRTLVVLPSVQPYLDLFPLPNADRVGEGIGRNTASQFLPSNESFFTVRLDHQISLKDSLFGRYTFDDATSQRGEASFLFNTVTNSRQQYLTLVGTHIFDPSLLITFRFGYTRPVSVGATISPLEIPRSLFFVSSAPQFGLINVPGLSTLGPNRSNPQSDVMNSFQYAGDMVARRGAHTLKFGAEAHRYRWDTFSSSRKGGSWNFNSLESFLQGGNQGTNLQVALPGSDNSEAYRQTLLAFYFNDTFALRPRLQLNLGLRYELPTVIHDRGGKTVFMPDPVRDPALQIGPVLDGNPFRRNFSPRVGIVWSPGSSAGGSGRSAVRANFGIYYDYMLKYVADQLKNSAPFFQVAVRPNFDASATFPDAVAASAGGGVPLQAQVLDYRGMASPAVMRYSLELEQEIPGGWSTAASYVGARGNHLFRAYEMNLFPLPIIRPDGSVCFPPDASVNPGRPDCPAISSFQAGPINPAFQGGITFYASDAQSFYHSVLLAARKSVGSGISVRASYTFSKSVDDTSSTGSPTQYGLLRTLDRGLSDFDIRHRLALNYFYTSPFSSGQRWGGRGVLSQALGGWRLGGIVRLRTGTPFSPEVNVRTPGYLFAPSRPDLLAGFSNNSTSGASSGCVDPSTGQTVVPAGQKLGGPDLYLDPCAYAAPAPGTLGNAGRNTVISPRIFNLDISLQREFSLDARKRLQFRAEIFNLFNHPNFDGVEGGSAIVFSGSAGRRNPRAGRITSTNTTARQIQFGLRLSL